MRREFPKQVKRDAFMRAEGQCEGHPFEDAFGHCREIRCTSKLTLGKYHYDHDIPDALGGQPTLDNCVVLCIACHKDKTTTKDVPAIAKTKRIQDRQIGIKKSGQKIASRGFQKAAPQRTASRPIERRT